MGLLFHVGLSIQYEALRHVYDVSVLYPYTKPVTLDAAGPLRLCQVNSAPPPQLKSFNGPACLFMRGHNKF
jgi:hypothetical protein